MVVPRLVFGPLWQTRASSAVRKLLEKCPRDRQKLLRCWAMTTLADQIEQLRARFFVGREAELARLSALIEPDAVRRVAAITGPGGVGKTELLRAFERAARERGARVAWLDAAALPASETAFA